MKQGAGRLTNSAERLPLRISLDGLGGTTEILGDIGDIWGALGDIRGAFGDTGDPNDLALFSSRGEWESKNSGSLGGPPSPPSVESRLIKILASRVVS